MADSIRAAAERLLKYLEANRGHDGMFPLSESQEEFNLRAALAAEPPAPAEPDTDAVLSSAPVPAAEGEREELAELLEEDGRHLVEVAFARECNKTWELARRVIRAAALLRQLPPDGLEAIRYCVEEDGAVIQRTSRAPESWAIRSCSSCMSTTGKWDIEPMPSNRTDEWLANHRWPSAAAAWAALQQARQQEVGDE